MAPDRLFVLLARAEACTWVLLLTGMFLKYVTDTTELGVKIAGPIHGVVFIVYVVAAVVIGTDQRWSTKQLVVAVAAAIPPLATIPLELHAERHGWLAPTWRLVDGQPAGPADRLVAWMLRHPGRGALAALVAVAALTLVALIVGPPGG